MPACAELLLLQDKPARAEFFCFAECSRASWSGSGRLVVQFAQRSFWPLVRPRTPAPYGSQRFLDIASEAVRPPTAYNEGAHSYGLSAVPQRSETLHDFNVQGLALRGPPK